LSREPIIRQFARCYGVCRWDCGPLGWPRSRTLPARRPRTTRSPGTFGRPSNACGSPPSGATVYTFDANGDETGAGSTTYSWDQEDRLVSTTQGGHTYAYGYDGDGNRVTKKTDGSLTDTYLWDPNGWLAELAIERDGAGSELRRYTYGDTLLQMNDGAADHSYMTDPFGSVANVTSSSGASELSYAFDPFGNLRSSSGSLTNYMRFDAQFLDTNANLYDLRARQYDPTIARFLEIDPVPNPLMMPHTGSYVYALDSPLVASDPSGLLCIIHNSQGGCLGAGMLDSAANWYNKYGWRILTGVAAGACILATTGGCAGIIAVYGAGQVVAVANRYPLSSRLYWANAGCTVFKSWALGAPTLAFSGSLEAAVEAGDISKLAWYSVTSAGSAPSIAGSFAESFSNPGCGIGDSAK
jgi:RHS repeat-associated protein